MKKILLALFLLITVASCKKDNDTKPTTPVAYGDVLVYSSDMWRRWSLDIDGTNYGSIGQSVLEPDCGEANFHNLHLTAGQHTMTIRSLSGLPDRNPETIVVVANSCDKINIQ